MLAPVDLQQAWVVFRPPVDDLATIFAVNGDAAALRDELAACFEKYKGLALDLNEVSECDTAGIQLVCSARASAAAADKSFVVSRASSSVSDVFLRAGLNMEDFQNLEKEKSDG